MSPVVRHWAAGLGAMLLAGCASGANSASPLPRCEPDLAEEIDRAVLGSLAGDYRVSFTATTGDSAGVSAEAPLRLVAATGALRRPAVTGTFGRSDVLLPYYGTLDLDVADLGGVTAGSPVSPDSMTPGILFIQQNDPETGAPRSITLRVGSEANDRGLSRFDGAYFALRATHVTGEVLAGTWASGDRRELSSGFFCAFRRAP